MKIRKTAITALCVVCAVFALSAFASCGLFSPKEADCDHEWGQWAVLTPAGCEEDGLQTRTCTLCGETEDETIPATGHTPGRAYASDENGHGTTCTVCGETLESEPHTFDEGQTSKAATCTEPGERLYSCTVCGWSYVEATDPLGHNHVAVRTVAPTCTEQGYTEYACTRCGDSYEADYTDPRHTLGDEFTSDENGHSGVCVVCGETLESEPHTFDGGMVTKETTCTEDGETVYTCTVCGYSYSVTEEKYGHDYVASSTGATCTEGGYTTYTCTRCGDTHTDDETPALGHAYVSEVTKEATCTEDGMATHTCQRCGDVYYETIEATGHCYDYNIDSHDDMYHWKECLVCGAMDVESYGRHSYTATTIKEATCTVDGEIEYVCGCGYSYTMTVSATGHDLSIVDVVGPTCEEYGYTVYECNICGYSYREINYLLAPTGHDWGDYNVRENADGTSDSHYQACSKCGKELEAAHSIVKFGTAATCTSAGTVTSICIVCGWYVTETTEAIGHTPKEGAYVENLEDGRHIYTCANCGTTVVEYCTFVYDEAASAPATCTEGGSDVYSCPICGAVGETIKTEALGHKYEAVVTDPTCTEKGYTTYTCTVCGDSYTDDYECPLGHDYVGEVTKEATCESAGEETYTCSRCGDTYTEDIAATSDQHTFADDPAERTYVYDSQKDKWGYVCDVCGKYVDALTDAEGITLYINDGTVDSNAPAALAKALTYDGVTVVLEMNVAMSGAGVAEYTAVTLDLGGNTLTLSGAMENAGTLVLVGGGTITAADGISDEALIVNSGTLVLDGVTFTSNLSPFSAVETTAGEVTVKDAAFATRTGIYVKGGDLNLESADFSTAGMYPVYAVGGTLNLEMDVEVYLGENSEASPIDFNFGVNSGNQVTVEITMSADAYIGSTFRVGAGMTVTLNMGKYSLILAANYDENCVVDNGGTLTLVSTGGQGNQLKSNTEKLGDYVVVNSGDLTMTKMYVRTYEESQVLIYNGEGAALTIEGGIYEVRKTRAIVNYGALTIENATLKDAGYKSAVADAYAGVAIIETYSGSSTTLTDVEMYAYGCGIEAYGGTLEIYGGLYMVSESHIMTVYGGTVTIEDATLKDSNYSDKQYSRVSEDESHALIESHAGAVTLTDVEMYAYECGVELYGGTLEVDGGLLATTYCDGTTSANGNHYFYVVYVPEGGDAGMTLSGNVTIKDGIGVAYGGTLDLEIDGEVKFDAYYDTCNGNEYPIASGRSAVENFGTMTIQGAGVLRMVNYAEENEENWANKSVDFTKSGNDYYFVRNFGDMTISGGVTISSPYTESALITNGWQTADAYTKDDHAGAAGSEVGKTEEGDPVYATMTITGGNFSGGKHVVKNDYAGKLVINGGTFYAVESAIKDESGATVAKSVVCNQSVMEITGGTFDSNGISSYVIYARDDDYDEVYEMGMTTISGGTFTSTGDYGVYLEAGDLYVEGGTFNGGTYPVYAVAGTLTVSVDAEIYLASGASMDAVTIEGGTVAVTLLGDAVIGSSLFVGEGAEAKIDLGGFILTLSTGYDEEAVIENHGTVTVIGGGAAKNQLRNSGAGTGADPIENYGVMTLTDLYLASSTWEYGAMVMNAEGATLTVDGGMYSANGSATAFYNAGTLSVTNATIRNTGYSGDVTDVSDALIVSGGDTTISGGTLEAKGTAVYLTGGTLTLSDTAPEAGSGFYPVYAAEGNVEITIEGDVTIKNSIYVAEGAEAGIAVGEEATLTSASGVSAIVNYGTAAISGTGTITYADGLENGDVTYLVRNFGDMTISGVTITSSYTHAALVENGWFTAAQYEADHPAPEEEEEIVPDSLTATEGFATLTIESGYISGGHHVVKNDYAGILDIEGGSFVGTSDSVIDNLNYAEISGGSFDGTNAKYVIWNHADPVVEYYHDPYLAVSGGSFKGGTAETVSAECGYVEISGGTFQAVGDTDVIKVTGGELLISDGTFVASTDEGAKGYCVYIVDGDVTVSGGTFIGNGIYGEATLTGGDLQGGIVYTGGTVTVSSSSTVYLEEGTYDEIIINTAEADIELLGSITIAATLVVPEGSTLTLDLAGNAITLTSDEAGAVIENHGTLTIVGGYASGNQIKNTSSAIGEYLIENYGDMALESLYLATSNAYTALVYNAEGAALTIEGGTYSANGTYTIENAGALTATNAAFTIVNSRSPSAAVIASSGDVEIIGGSIKTDAAAALYVTGGTLTLTGLTVTTSDGGYPVYVAGTGVCVTINETVAVGGTIFVEAGAEATLAVEGILMESTAAVLIVNHGEATIEGSGEMTFASSIEDAGVLVYNYGTMTITGSLDISSPYTDKDLIYNGWGSANAYKADNPSAYDEETGEEIPSENVATLTIEGGSFTGGRYTISNNRAGVLCITGGTFTAIDGTQIVVMNMNVAEISGGEFYGEYENGEDGETLAYASHVVYNRTDPDNPALGQGILTISGGSFYGGTYATLYVRADADAVTTVTGGTFANENGRYTLYAADGTLYIQGGDFTGGTYAVYIADGTADVSGGTFSGAYGVYLADGDLCVEDGTFTGAAYGVYVVNGTLTLAMDGVEAYIDAAEGSVINLILEKDTVATVTLLNSVTIGSQIYVGEGQTLTLDLGGYSLTLDSSSSDTSVIVNHGTVDIIGGSKGYNQIFNSTSDPVYMIENYGTMTITDLRINSSKGYEAFVLSDGGLTVSGSSFNGSGTYLIESYGTLTIENSDLTIKGTDSAAVIVSGGDTAITDSSLTANAGNGIYLTGGTLTLSDTAPEAGDGFYPVYAAEGNVEITIEGDVTIENSIYVAEGAEAGIAVGEEATLTAGSAAASAIVNYGTAEISGTGAITFADEIETEGILISNFGTMTITGNPEISSPYANSTLVDNGWSNESTYKAENPSTYDEETGEEILSDVVATLTIEGGGFTGGVYTVRNNRAGELYITGGTFTAVDGTYCLVLNVNYAEISGGEFYGEFDVDDDEYEEDPAFAKYVIYSRSNSASGPTALGQGYMKISGGTFVGGTTANLYATGASTVDVYGKTFTESDSGYSVYADDNAVITIYAGSFYGENGTVQKNGGRIINIGGSFGESGVTVTGGDYTIYTSDTVYISATCEDPINITIESDEANVVLIGYTVLGSTLVVPEGTTLNLDLGKYELTLSSDDGDTAIIDNRGTLNVCGGSVTAASGEDALILNTGEMTLTDITVKSGSKSQTLIVNGSSDGDDGILTIEGSTLEADEGHLVENYGTLEIANTTLKDSNYTDTGNKQTKEDESHALIDIYSGTVTLTDVEMDAYECGVEMFGGDLTIDGGTFATPYEMSTNADGTHDYFYYIVYVSEGENTLTVNGDVTFKDGVCVAYGATLDLTVDGTLALDVYYPNYSSSSRFPDGRYLVENYGTMTIKGDGVIEQCDYAVKYADKETYTSICEDLAGLTASDVTYLICNYGTMTIEDVTITTPYTLSALIHNGWSKASDEQGDSHKGSNTDKTLTDENGEPVYATLTIEGGSFSGGKHVVKSDYDGYLVINGGTFTALESASSVICNQDILEITGGTFDGTAGANYVIYDRDDAYDATYEMGVTTISGGEFVAGENICVYVTAGSATTISGGTFTSTGDCVVYLESGDLYVEGGTITGGEYPIYAAAGTLTVSADAEIYLASNASMDAVTIEGGTVAITLLGKVTLGSEVYVGEGAEATLDMGGNIFDTASGFADSVMIENLGTLTIYGASATTNQFANYGNAAIKVLVENHGSMTLKDVRISTTVEYDALIFNEGDLAIEGGYYNAKSAAYVIENEGTLKISNAELIARESGSVEAVIASSGDAEVTDSEITANVGNGICLTGGTLTLAGVTINVTSGYAVYVAEGDVEITMSGDVVEDDAIFVAVDASADITVDDGATLTSASGASAIVNYGTMTIEGAGAITYADGATPAAELIVNRGEMTIDGVEVYSTSTTKNLIVNGWGGQNAYASDENVQIQTLNITDDGFASLTIEGGTFSGGNNVIRNSYAGQLEIKGGEFAAISGSGAIVFNVNDATISGGTFEAGDCAYYAVSNNIEDGDLSSGTLTIEGGTLTGGTVAVVKTSGGDVTISKGTITAEGDVYGVLVYGGTLTVSGGTIDGDIHNEGGSVEVTGGTVGETTTVSGDVVISSSDMVYIGTTDESGNNGAINITIEATTANVTLVGNVTLGSLIYVAEKKTLNLYLGEYTLTLSDEATDEYVIENAGTLNLTGSWTTDEESNITTSQISGAATLITNSGTATLSGVYIAETGESPVTIVESSKTLTVSGSSLSNANGNAIEITAGTLTLTNAYVNAGSETYTGYAVCVSGNSVTVTVSGDATTLGAAIYVAEGVTGMTLTVSGTLLSNGATAVENRGTMTMSGSGTTTYADGATISDEDILVSNFGTMTITGGKIISSGTASDSCLISNGWSSSSYDGDGATASLTINNSGVTLEGGYFVIKNGYAGVLSISNGTFTAISGTNSVLYNMNQATITGGTFDGTYARYAVYNRAVIDEELSKSALTISNANAKLTGGSVATLRVAGGTLTVSANATVTATDGVIALYVTGGEATISNGTYTATDGKAVYVTGGLATIKGGTYKGAYGVYLDGGDATISSGTFTNADTKVFAASGTLTDSLNTAFYLGEGSGTDGLNLYISKSGTINIYLDGNVTLGSTFEIASNQTVNLYLYGYTLTLSTTYDTDNAVINNKGTLSVYGGWTDGDDNAVVTSQITGGETLIVNSGTLTLSGVYIAEGTEDETPATIVESSKTLTVSESSLSNTSGDAIEITAGTLTLTNAYVNAGSETYTGYAVYVESSSGTVTVTISSGTVTLGSAIYVAQGTVTLTVTGTLLSNGATAVENHGTTNISSSGKITYADGLESVEYLIANMGTMTITGVTVSSAEYHSTTLISNGWAVVTEHDGSSSAKLTISGGTYEGGCYTVRNGYAGELTVSGGTFNTITGQQAILYNLNYTKVSGGTFNGDLSKYVVYNAKSTYIDEDYYKAEFETSGTSATFNGGTVATLYVTGGTVTISSNVKFYAAQDESGEYGTVVKTTGGYVTITNGTFYGAFEGDADTTITISGGTLTNITSCICKYITGSAKCPICSSGDCTCADDGCECGCQDT